MGVASLSNPCVHVCSGAFRSRPQKSPYPFADRTSGNFSTALTLPDRLQSLQGVLAAGLTRYLNYKDDTSSLSVACMKLE